ncbi:hypothetical protein DSO57_1015111 [Entomophthora muscae]|uniref:Uncharacterized protein n=1 Tax=Entomophthora muscae TaxID=34485 RepID=A0ACC2SU46_9FUNG|nr:hypothetical protein DSO57_1015111 [Entomophthora muscae]
MSYSLQPAYQPFPNYNSYVAELVSGTVYVPYTCTLVRGGPEFILYIDTLLAKIRISKITGILALIYCDRLRCRLPSNACGSSDTLYQVYTASLLVACKHLGEKFTIKDFAMASGLYTLKDMVRMEFELLQMLDYHTWVSDNEIQGFFDDNRDGLTSVCIPKDI